MEAFIIIFLYVLLIIISSIPCFIICFIARKLVPSQYKVNPKQITLISIVFAILTAILLGVELESGIMSAPIILIGLSVVWSFLILFLIALYRGYINAKST